MGGEEQRRCEALEGLIAKCRMAEGVEDARELDRLVDEYLGEFSDFRGRTYVAPSIVGGGRRAATVWCEHGVDDRSQEGSIFCNIRMRSDGGLVMRLQDEILRINVELDQLKREQDRRSLLASRSFATVSADQCATTSMIEDDLEDVEGEEGCEALELEGGLGSGPSAGLNSGSCSSAKDLKTTKKKKAHRRYFRRKNTSSREKTEQDEAEKMLRSRTPLDIIALASKYYLRGLHSSGGGEQEGSDLQQLPVAQSHRRGPYLNLGLGNIRDIKRINMMNNSVLGYNGEFLRDLCKIYQIYQVKYVRRSEETSKVTLGTSYECSIGSGDLGNKRSLIYNTGGIEFLMDEFGISNSGSRKDDDETSGLLIESGGIGYLGSTDYPSGRGDSSVRSERTGYCDIHLSGDHEFNYNYLASVMENTSQAFRSARQKVRICVLPGRIRELETLADENWDHRPRDLKRYRVKFVQESRVHASGLSTSVLEEVSLDNDFGVAGALRRIQKEGQGRLSSLRTLKERVHRLILDSEDRQEGARDQLAFLISVFNYLVDEIRILESSLGLDNREIQDILIYQDDIVVDREIQDHIEIILGTPDHVSLMPYNTSLCYPMQDFDKRWMSTSLDTDLETIRGVLRPIHGDFYHPVNLFGYSLGIGRVRKHIAKRKLTIQRELSNIKRSLPVLNHCYKRYLTYNEVLNSQRDLDFTWGCLPLRAIDHPDQVVPLPIGYLKHDFRFKVYHKFLDLLPVYRSNDISKTHMMSLQSMQTPLLFSNSNRALVLRDLASSDQHQGASPSQSRGPRSGDGSLSADPLVSEVSLRTAPDSNTLADGPNSGSSIVTRRKRGGGGGVSGSDHAISDVAQGQSVNVVTGTGLSQGRARRTRSNSEGISSGEQGGLVSQCSLPSPPLSDPRTPSEVSGGLVSSAGSNESRSVLKSETTGYPSTANNMVPGSSSYLNLSNIGLGKGNKDISVGTKERERERDRERDRDRDRERERERDRDRDKEKDLGLNLQKNREREKGIVHQKQAQREWMQMTSSSSSFIGPSPLWFENSIFRYPAEIEYGVYDRDPDLPARVLYTSRNGLICDPRDQERNIRAIWTISEIRMFIEKYLMYPKDFRRIASFMEHKTIKDCIDFYYKYKYTLGLKRILRIAYYLKSQYGKGQYSDLGDPESSRSSEIQVSEPRRQGQQKGRQGVSRRGYNAAERLSLWDSSVSTTRCMEIIKCKKHSYRELLIDEILQTLTVDSGYNALMREFYRRARFDSLGNMNVFTEKQLSRSSLSRLLYRPSSMFRLPVVERRELEQRSGAPERDGWGLYDDLIYRFLFRVHDDSHLNTRRSYTMDNLGNGYIIPNNMDAIISPFYSISLQTRQGGSNIHIPNNMPIIFDRREYTEAESSSKYNTDPRISIHDLKTSVFLYLNQFMDDSMLGGGALNGSQSLLHSLTISPSNRPDMMLSSDLSNYSSNGVLAEPGGTTRTRSQDANSHGSNGIPVSRLPTSERPKQGRRKRGTSGATGSRDSGGQDLGNANLTTNCGRKMPRLAEEYINNYGNKNCTTTPGCIDTPAGSLNIMEHLAGINALLLAGAARNNEPCLNNTNNNAPANFIPQDNSTSNLNPVPNPFLNVNLGLDLTNPSAIPFLGGFPPIVQSAGSQSVGSAPDAGQGANACMYSAGHVGIGTGVVDTSSGGVSSSTIANTNDGGAGTGAGAGAGAGNVSSSGNSSLGVGVGSQERSGALHEQSGFGGALGVADGSSGLAGVPGLYPPSLLFGGLGAAIGQGGAGGGGAFMPENSGSSGVGGADVGSGSNPGDPLSSGILQSQNKAWGEILMNQYLQQQLVFQQTLQEQIRSSQQMGMLGGGLVNPLNQMIMSTLLGGIGIGGSGPGLNCAGNGNSAYTVPNSGSVMNEGVSISAQGSESKTDVKMEQAPPVGGSVGCGGAENLREAPGAENAASGSGLGAGGGSSEAKGGSEAACKTDYAGSAAYSVNGVLPATGGVASGVESGLSVNSAVSGALASRALNPTGAGMFTQPQAFPGFLQLQHLFQQQPQQSQPQQSQQQLQQQQQQQLQLQLQLQQQQFGNAFPFALQGQQVFRSPGGDVLGLLLQQQQQQFLGSQLLGLVGASAGAAGLVPGLGFGGFGLGAGILAGTGVGAPTQDPTVSHEPRANESQMTSSISSNLNQGDRKE
ncbi:MYB domain-containing protein [Cryptosporidium canis]|uniref:MYB domain-containing protein n=1 Tax=Cryptosporidium canis TaxID=195482 RepID=A0ABQ8PAX5_9CRYT|nr:MYB domain-containing protein [Cryptosporidium canis]